MPIKIIKNAKEQWAADTKGRVSKLIVVGALSVRSSCVKYGQYVRSHGTMICNVSAVVWVIFADINVQGFS